MYAPLPAGNTYYNPPAGGRTKPGAATIAMFPHVEFDTYFTSPLDLGDGVGAPADLGTVVGAGISDLGGTSGLINASWGNLVVDPPGTFEIWRWTFPAGVFPTIFSNRSFVSQVNPLDDVIIPNLPEPSLPWGLTVALALGFAREFRSRRDAGASAR